jgi:hypothetical protein
MLSQPKSAVLQQAAKLFQQQGNYDLNSAYENADRLLEQNRTGSKFHYVTPKTTYIANLYLHLPEEVFLIQ